MDKFDPLARWICSQTEKESSEEKGASPEQQVTAASAAAIKPRPALVQKPDSKNSSPSQPKQGGGVIELESPSVKPLKTKKAS